MCLFALRRYAGNDFHTGVVSDEDADETAPEDEEPEEEDEDSTQPEDEDDAAL